MGTDMFIGDGDKDAWWQGPRIGTCGDPVDKLRISFCRVRCIPDIIVGFDGERDCWVVYGSFYTPDKGDFMLQEVASVSEDALDEERFV